MKLTLSGIISRLRDGSSPSLEERNRLLEKKVVEAERRAALLEDEAKIRARLVTAQARSKRAKQEIGAGRSRPLVRVLVVVIIVVILFLTVRSCDGVQGDSEIAITQKVSKLMYVPKVVT